MPDNLQAGLVGFGVAGRYFHAPLIAATPGMRLAKIAQRHGDEAFKAYPQARTVRDARALIEDPSLDLIVIATPNTSHFSLASAALAANKHVVVEKPFTVTLSEAQQLIDLAQERHRILSVFHNRRWDADFLTVRRLLNAQLLGRVVEYEMRFDRFRPLPKVGARREQDTPGSGLLYDLGSHLIDQTLLLFGTPERVRCSLRRQRVDAFGSAVSAPDCFEVALDYAGLTATLKAGMLVREPGPQIALHGTRGSFLKQRSDPQEDALRAGVLPMASEWGREHREQWGRLNTEIDGLHFEGSVESEPGDYRRFYANIRDAIVSGSALEVTADQARDVIRVIELAIESDACGRAIAWQRPAELEMASH